MKIPYVSQELLDYLTRLWPDRAPDTTDSVAQMRVSAGRQEVIRKLRKMHEDQLKNAVQQNRAG